MKLISWLSTRSRRKKKKKGKSDIATSRGAKWLSSLFESGPTDEMFGSLKRQQ